MANKAKTGNISFLPRFTFSNLFPSSISVLRLPLVILYVLLAEFLPLQDENLVAMYKKIYRGDPWFLPKAQRRPNWKTRIAISKIMESSWFKKSIPNTKTTKEETEFEALNGEKSSKLKTLNAFHIISLLEGFDLSPLF
ncbi:hypothetical protein Goshw_001193 [Gossypium schwendimanii]|uniref:non-specific serine/threonine protein kinase n=1 Tax=Gossypium schwendimanii TaxID=34291 RepID=A0A7J9M9T0_GOSSC|nr:hypothetical protein [Gossypium schwendimanii]